MCMLSIIIIISKRKCDIEKKEIFLPEIFFPRAVLFNSLIRENNIILANWRFLISEMISDMSIFLCSNNGEGFYKI